MNSDFEKAKTVLNSGGHTIVLVKGNHTITSSDRGVKPLIDLLNSGYDYAGYSASDKVIGKAAAFLYILLGIKNIYGKVMSKFALEVFEEYNVNYEYDLLVDNINNRTNTGWCPMENAVRNISAPETALDSIVKKLKELSQK